MQNKELENAIMEKIEFLLERNKHIFMENNVDAFVLGSALVRRVQDATGFSKMTIWRYIHKLEKQGKIILENHPPILLKTYHIKLAKS